MFITIQKNNIFFRLFCCFFYLLSRGFVLQGYHPWSQELLEKNSSYTTIKKINCLKFSQSIWNEFIHILKFTKKKNSVKLLCSFFHKVKYWVSIFFYKWTCEVIRCFKKIGVFLVTKHVSLSSVSNVSLWTIFPLLKNRWAKHDLVIFNSVMNMFCQGYNNLLFNFNCFKWMQWIQLYNKKFAFHRSIRM